MNHKLLPLLIAVGTCLIGSSLAIAAALWQARNNDLSARDRFNSQSVELAHQVEERVQHYEYGLRGARGAFLAVGADQMTRERFATYSATRDLAQEFPGAHGFGIIRRIAGSDLEHYVAAAREDGWPSFTVRELSANEGDRYLIQYIEPIEANRAAVGLDIASETHRRAAALESMQSGRATITAPITLVQDTAKLNAGFLVLLPIYANGAPLGSIEERMNATLGWSFVPLLINDVLRGLNAADDQITFSLRDASAPDTPVIYRSPGSKATVAVGLEHQISTTIFGRRWHIDTRATPRFVSNLRQPNPLHTAAAGCAIALLLALLAYVLAAGARRTRALNADLERQVTERTRELDTARHTLQTILDAVPSQIGYWDTELRNRVANRAYQDWFGIDPEQLRGKHIREVLGETIYAANLPHLQAALRGEAQSFPGMPVPRPGGGSARHTLVNYLPDLIGGEVRGVYTFLYDVSDLVAEKTKLAAAERDLRTILDAVPSTIGYWDRELINRVANKAYKEWFGFDVETVRGMTLRELLGEELFARNRPYIEAALRGEPQTFERVFPKADGTGYRHALSHYLPDVVDGEVRGFYALVHDVTELVQSRLDLESVRRDNRALLEIIHQHTIVSVTDRSGRIIDVNDGFCSISGYSREELIGKSHSIINSDTHERTFWSSVWRRIASGQSWRGEVCNRAKDGSLYWVDSIISPFFGDDGKIERYVSIRTDISERKRAQAELLTTSSLLQDVLDAASEMSIIATTVDGTINVFNRGAERLLGYSETEMVGKCTPAVIHLRAEVEARGRELSQKYDQLIAGFQVFVHHARHFGAETREWTYVRKDGTHVPVSMTVTAVRDSKGEPAGYLGIAVDVSEQRNQEQSLRAATAKAEEANLAKGRFLANMSHEIRTPMNAVIGLTHILESTALTAHQVGLVNKIKIAGKSLLAIINDLLDLSKIEAAEMKLEHVPFNLNGLLQELSSLVTVQVDAKGIAFQVDTPPDLPAVLIGDPTRLHQVLLNLLTNAVKFTERGGVRLRVQEVASQPHEIRLRFIVQDSGIGIAPDAIEQLFRPFVQADSSTTRRFGGTGLGLSIVRQLVTLMDGELAVTSTPGVGSEFRVELVLARGDELGTALLERPNFDATAAETLAGVRVLVVDDSPINLEVAKCVLESQGAAVELAANGQEAVDFLVAQPEAVDIVLMDVHMPVLDGHDAARRIRCGLGLTCLPIIALTAGALASERHEAETSGMNDFISKPFSISALVNCILRHVAVPARIAPTVANAPTLSSDTPWPDIAGIDTTDVRTRLRGDLPLLRSMLRRLLEQFVNLDHVVVVDANGFRDLATILHELKGSAGTLGAKSIQALAAETEAACRAHDTRRCLLLLQNLAAALGELRAAAAPFLSTDAADGAVRSAGLPVALQAEDLDGLIRVLQQYDLAAVDRANELSEALQQHLGLKTHAILRKHIEDLRFSEAAKLLRESQSQRATGS